MSEIVVYVRQSLDRTGQGLAVTRQEEECRSYAEGRGWTVTTVFADNDISATTGKRRPGFEALLAQDLPVVTWHQDRLLRLSRDLERVLDAGLEVHTVQSGAVDLTNAAGRAYARTVAAWSTYEGEQKSARQKASARQRAASGKPWWPLAPFGYEKDGALSPQAHLVRSAYGKVLQGVTIADITREWAEVSVSPRGKPWLRTSVLQVLKAERNAGLRTYRGEVVGQGTWEPIVDEGTFYAVQAILGDPVRGKGGGARKNLLTGVATCGKCTRKMVSCWNGSPPYRARAYRCPTGHLSVKAEWLEGVVRAKALEAPEKPAGSSGVPQWRRPGTTPAQAALSDEAQELRERLDEAMSAYTSGAISTAVWSRATTDLERRLEENLTAMMEAVQVQHLTVPSGKAFDTMTPAEQHAHLKATFDVLVKPVERYTRRTPESIEVTTRR